MSPGAEPALLTPGAEVAVVAPSGPFDRDRFDLGVRILQDRGLVARFDPAMFDRWRFLAGPDARRRDELVDALTRPGVAAVWAARGGYGSMRLLEDLPWEALRDAAPRWLVGFSDVTALHLAWVAAGRAGAVHGPNVTTLGEVGGTDREQVFGLLTGALPAPALGAERLRVVVPGVAEGPVWGGNLSIVSRLVGTPYLPDPAGAVLFLEDVGERPYRLDRMLTHLRLAGVLGKVAAVVLGDFVGCEEDALDCTAHDVLEERLRGLGVPVLAGYPAGHGNRLRALPFGGPARVVADGEYGRVELLAAPGRRAEAPAA